MFKYLFFFDIPKIRPVERNLFTLIVKKIKKSHFFTYVKRSLTEKKHMCPFQLATFVPESDYMKTVFFIGSLAVVAMISSCRTTEEISKVEPGKEPVTVPTEPAKEEGLSADALVGEGLFNQHCGRCHDLPKIEDYSAEKWDRIVPSMAKKSRLTPEQETSVMTYVKESLK